MPRKRHWEVRVERFFGSYCQKRGLIHGVRAEPQTKEVADGCFYARLALAVPIHPQDNFLQVIRLAGGHCDPDMTNLGGAVLVKQSKSGPGFQTTIVPIPARPV